VRELLEAQVSREPGATTATSSGTTGAPESPGTPQPPGPYYPGPGRGIRAGRGPAAVVGFGKADKPVAIGSNCPVNRRGRYRVCRGRWVARLGRTHRRKIVSFCSAPPVTSTSADKTMFVARFGRTHLRRFGAWVSAPRPLPAALNAGVNVKKTNTFWWSRVLLWRAAVGRRLGLREPPSPGPGTARFSSRVDFGASL
jgi:hypothetical protein